MRTKIIDVAADYAEVLPPWWLLYPGLTLGAVFIIWGVFRLVRGRTFEEGIHPVGVGLGAHFMMLVGYPALRSAQLREVSGADPALAPAGTSPAIDLSGPLAGLIIAASVAILLGVGVAVARIVGARKRRRVEAERSREECAARWEAARELHRDAVGTMASYELDVAKAIEFPAFNDVSVPEVATMARALRRVRDLELQIDRDSVIGGSDELLSAYRTAAEGLVAAVAVAEAAAQRIRWSSIPKDEQKDLKLARKLLHQAEDPGNPESLRHGLYERLKIVVDRLNSHHGAQLIPPATAGQIEGRARLLIEAPDAQAEGGLSSLEHATV